MAALAQSAACLHDCGAAREHPHTIRRALIERTESALGA
jgi:hypothetical protein